MNMSINMNMNMKLHGYLLGYDIVQNGIVVTSHKYAVPVDNMVVNSGKDALLGLSSGSPHMDGMFGVASSTYYRSGVLSYCGRGSGTTATTAGMTGLAAQVGSNTGTILPNHPNTGTMYDRSNGKVIMRVTHDHTAESSDVNINELAWFGRAQGPGAYVMFSRVVLPSTITVLAGQALRSIYQLEVTVSPVVSTPCSPTITGWTTDGDCRFECTFPATSTTLGSSANSLFDVVSNSGSLVACAQDASKYGLKATTTQYDGMVTMYGTSQTFNSFGTGIVYPVAGATVYNIGINVSSGTSSKTLQSYTNGTFYRDTTVVAEPDWTGLASISIYAIRIFGLMYIFDNPQTKTKTQRLTLTYRISVS